MTTDRHPDIADRLEAYVLGQLSEHERRDVEVHLRTCGVCSQDVRELNAVLDGIAASVPPIAPSSTLRQRLLDQVAVLPQEPERAGRPAASGRRPLRRMMPLAAAAALVLALGAAGYQYQERRQLAGEVAQARAVNEELQQRLRRFTGQTDLALSILTAEDMREIPMGGRETAVAAGARAYWSPTRGLLVAADRLPAPPPGRIYQVWVIEGNEPVSAGLLGAEPGNRGMLIATPPRPGGGGNITVAVTDEPPGGLSAPSGSIRLAGSV